jgi:ribonucleoside-diphosphate reductase beta chain
VDEQYELYRRLSKRRLEALAVARAMNVTEVEASSVEAFEPEELRHVS